MSREARAFVWDDESIDDPRTLLIMLSIADVADEWGWGAYPSVRRLAKDSRGGERSVQRHLRDLVAAGVLEETEVGRRARPTTYRIVQMDPEREHEPRRMGDKMAPKATSARASEHPSPTEPKGAVAPPLGRRCGDIVVTSTTSSPLIGTGSGTEGNHTHVEQARPDDAQTVFDAWVRATGKGQARLTKERRGLIVRRLKQGWAVDELVDACCGWSKSPHHRGENSTGTVYNDMELLLRDTKHIEMFRDLERGTEPGGLARVSPITNGPRSVGDKNLVDLAGWANRAEGRG